MCDADHSSRLCAQRIVFLKPPIRSPAQEGRPEDLTPRSAGRQCLRAGRNGLRRATSLATDRGEKSDWRYRVEQ